MAALLQGQRCLAPADLGEGPAWAEVFAAPEFLAGGSPAEQAVLTRQLGVPRLSRAQLYRAHVLPRLARLSPASVEAVMLEVREAC